MRIGSLFRGKKPKALPGNASKAERAAYKSMVGQHPNKGSIKPKKRGFLWRFPAEKIIQKTPNQMRILEMLRRIRKKSPIRVLVLCMDGAVDSVFTAQYATLLARQIGISNKIKFYPGSYANPDFFVNQIRDRKFFPKLDYVLVRPDVSYAGFIASKLEAKYRRKPEIFASKAYSSHPALSGERSEGILLEILEKELAKSK